MIAARFGVTLNAACASVRRHGLRRPWDLTAIPLISTAPVADAADVVPTTILTWVRRGLLPVALRSPLGYLYQPEDVAAVVASRQRDRQSTPARNR